jgi:hypothetical protein
MIFAVIRKLFAVLAFSIAFLATHAQSLPPDYRMDKAKPYRILTSGKQITIKSSKDIQSIMVWTASGHRIVEQKEVNAGSYTFTVGVNEKIFFLMLELKGEERYTEKIGIR